eukprot:scaffold907_cov247-Pinguiococcus_pyrenoidosus.AAC.19
MMSRCRANRLFPPIHRRRGLTKRATPNRLILLRHSHLTSTIGRSAKDSGQQAIAAGGFRTCDGTSRSRRSAAGSAALSGPRTAPPWPSRRQTVCFCTTCRVSLTLEEALPKGHAIQYTKSRTPSARAVESRRLMPQKLGTKHGFLTWKASLQDRGGLSLAREQDVVPPV